MKSITVWYPEFMPSGKFLRDLLTGPLIGMLKREEYLGKIYEGMCHHLTLCLPDKDIDAFLAMVREMYTGIAVEIVIQDIRYAQIKRR